VEVCPFGVLEIKNGKVIVKYPEKCKKMRGLVCMLVQMKQLK